MGDEQELRGVGGWLAFFLVSLGIFTPIVGAIGLGIAFSDSEAAFLLGPSWQTLRTASIALVAAEVALGWFVCYRFLRIHNWQTVRIGIFALILLALVSRIGEPLLVSLITGIDFGMIAGAMGFDLVRPIVYSTVWTLYLLNSKRVRNTYGSVQGDQVRHVFS